jgi:hypothetical protein
MTDWVIVEWLTYEIIPHIRHVFVASRDRATEWAHGGAPVTIHEIDPELKNELASPSSRKTGSYPPSQRGS